MSDITASIETKKGPSGTRSQIPRRVPAVLVAALVVIVGIYFGFVRHEASALKKASANLSAQQSVLTKVKGQVNKVHSDPAYMPALYKATQTAETLLPVAPDPGFLNTLVSDANAAGLNSGKVAAQFSTSATQVAGASPTATSAGASTPTTPAAAASASSGGLSFKPYQATVTGSYANILAFMQAVSSNPELVTFTNVHVSSATASGAAQLAGGANSTGSYTANMGIDLWFSPAPTLTTGSSSSTTTPAGSGSTSTHTGAGASTLATLPSTGG